MKKNIQNFAKKRINSIFVSDYSLLISGDMTIRKDNIIKVALELFAKHGYSNTSTSKIAKQANVSEGLIFRHFKNKEGLLDAIVSIGTGSFEQYIVKLQAEKDAKKRISLAIDFPINVMSENKDYWNLVASLKYQSPEIAQKYHNSETLLQLQALLQLTLRELGYKNPEMETKYLILIISGLTTLFKQNTTDKEIKELTNYIKLKYEI